MVKRDGGNEMVKDMGLNDAMHEVAADEAKLTINRGGGSADKRPSLVSVVRKRGIGVLKKGDGHYFGQPGRKGVPEYLPSQWLIHR